MNDAGVVEIERRIAAAPETVFAYFTDPERYVRWQGLDARLDPRPGGEFRVTMSGRSNTVATGTFVEIDPPRRLVFTWGWEERGPLPVTAAVPPGSSTVEVDLVPDGDGTILRLRHSGLATPDARAFHTYGWGVTLERLVVTAAGGDPGRYAFADA